MRKTPRRIIPLAVLVKKLRADSYAYKGSWSVYCQTCEKYHKIWPDKENILCGDCSSPLVALVETSEM